MAYQDKFMWQAGQFTLPDFVNIADSDWLPAFEEAMAAQRLELEAIATDPDEPTIELIVGWERSQNYLNAVGTAFWTAKDADTNELRDQVDEVVAPKLAAHRDAILLDERLYAKLVALAGRIDDGQVVADEQDRWWCSEQLRAYRRNGITLGQDDRARLSAINQQIATCQTRYSNLVVKGRGASAVHVQDEARLAGLSPQQRDELRRAAQSKGLDGWLIELVNTTRQPILATLDDRELRQQVFQASIGRGKGDWDVRPVILELINLRQQKAHLLGFDNYSAYVADDGCAKTTAAIMDLLGKAATAALANAQREAVDLQAQLDQLAPGAQLEPWDWAWLAEKSRQAKFAIDEAALAPYLQFEAVRSRGIFGAANRLYGLTFHARGDIAGYTNQCETFEVRDADGSTLGLIQFDPYARASKQGGAWMTSLTQQSHMDDQRPVVTNNCNQTSPAPGQPSLMTWEEVTTLFHEFGHDLHGLLANSVYPSLSGTNTPGDYVEFPSQVNEMWAWEPSIIADFARHIDTGEPMPPALRETLLAARHFGEGFDALEIFAAMLLDQAWHQADADELPATIDGVDDFEQTALAKFGVDFALIPPRYRSCYFSHIWGSDYAAGYYGYLWAEVLDADSGAWFAENGGLTRQNGDRFRREVLALGGSVDVMAAYRRFRGADPDPIHLFRRRGLV